MIRCIVVNWDLNFATPPSIKANLLCDFSLQLWVNSTMHYKNQNQPEAMCLEKLPDSITHLELME